MKRRDLTLSTAGLTAIPFTLTSMGNRSFRYTPAMTKYLSLITLTFISALATAQSRVQDVIYMKSGGAAFTMDVVKPAKANKAAVIFMVSGGWFSDHTMLKSFMPDIEKAFIEGGFTVFEVVHGAQPRFKVSEIVDQVRTATRFVHEHAAEYGVEPNRLGVSGISSGGHLSLMIAGSPDCHVAAVAAIAPPTDLANWGKTGFVLTDDPVMAMFAPPLGIDVKAARTEIESVARNISPITLVSPKFPPTLIVHGDSDNLVPLQQSQSMDQTLGKAGVQHKLDIVAGGGHDEKTFGPGVMKALQWFREKLLR